MNSSQSNMTAPISMCFSCGKTIDPIYLGGRWLTPLCTCEQKLKLKEILAVYEKDKRISIADAVLGINPKVKNCTFDNFIPREEVNSALFFAKNYAINIQENVENGRGIIFMGDYGTGKSHISAAIANTALSSGFVVVYEVITELLSKIRNTYARKEESSREPSELKLIDTLCSCDLLILDDLGAEKSSVWTESIIFTIVNRRYVSKKPIIISTNLTIEEFPEKVSQRALDRLIEMNMLIELTGESYRKIIARERMKEVKNGGL
jgi:DNA replication protein DnaC